MTQTPNRASEAGRADPSPTDPTPTDPTPTDPAVTEPTAGLAPIVPGAPVVKQTERPHPLTPFIRGWLIFVAVVIGFFRQLIPDGEQGDNLEFSDLHWIVLVVIGVVLLAAVTGFFSWFFTRFVIDDEELRIETGAVFKNSKKVPFERVQSIDLIQPFAARLFGLVELRIEVGAGDSTIKLRYLTRTKASQLRDYLLTRAHGQDASVSELATTPGASAFTDLSVADRPLVTVTPQRLIGSFMLSSEWLMTALIVIVVFVVTTFFDVTRYAIPGLIPLLIGAVSMIGRRVVSMFNFTLAESPRGLRITRGLTNLTSQSVPINRIQGVKVTQPILWKPFDWYRIDVDVLGYAAGSSENNESGATSVLLPVANRDEVAVAMSRVLPGVDLEQVELHPSPRRARWLSWFDFWTLRYGWSDRVLITQHGWLVVERNIVPHAKTQSVRIAQGPLQRRLRLADVHVDTPKGPVNAVAHQLDLVAARELALSQLDRARLARAADRERVAVADVSLRDDESGEDEVLAHFGTSADQLLGSGGESRVFAIDEERVLRIYRRSHEAPQPTALQLRALYDGWAGTDPGIEVPRILDVGEIAGRFYTVDRRMSGRSFSSWLADAPMEDRRAALSSYLDAALALRRLPVPVPGFARLVGEGAPQQFGSLVELLTYQMSGAIAVSQHRLDQDLPQVAQVWSQLQDDLSRRQCEPALVHGDLCPPNAFVSRAADGSAVVTGICDFSPHTLAADPLMDVAGAVCQLELTDYPGAVEDAIWLGELATQRLGPETAHWIAVYCRFYGFYFSSAYAFDPALYAWCLRQLER
ncbi:MAG: PH domain-containing protein [Propionibacteriaceae bacterium]